MVELEGAASDPLGVQVIPHRRVNDLGGCVKSGFLGLCLCPRAYLCLSERLCLPHRYTHQLYKQSCKMMTSAPQRCRREREKVASCWVLGGHC